MGLAVTTPADHGMAALMAVHSAPYLEFLQTAHAQWKQMPDDWGDEVMSNVFVREPNAVDDGGRDAGYPAPPHRSVRAQLGRSRRVWRRSRKAPRHERPQMNVNPRKLNVCGLPCPLRCRRSIA